MKKQKIRLSLKSYDHQLLDKAVKQIVFAATRTGCKVIGPIPLPNKSRIITVLTSPHIDKKAREQFVLRTHKRILDIVAPADPTMAMEALMKVNISSGVDVEIS